MISGNDFCVGDRVTITEGDFSGFTGSITHIHPPVDMLGDELIRVKTQENPPGNIVVRRHQLRRSLILWN